MDLKEKQIIYVDNKLYIKCGVVMLSTESESYIYKNRYGIPQFRQVSGLTRIDSIAKNQHLYITSDEEIKKDDWYYNPITDSIHKADLILRELNPIFKKIIATTDTSLKIHKFDKGVFKDLTYSLPQLPQQFIQQYIEEYNKGNVITKVEVEYDFADHDLALFRDEITLKVNHDNTINIKPIKDSWSREDIIKLKNKLISLSKEQQFKILDSVETFDKWIEENL